MKVEDVEDNRDSLGESNDSGDARDRDTNSVGDPGLALGPSEVVEERAQFPVSCETLNWFRMRPEAKQGQVVLLMGKGWRRPIPAIWVKTKRTEGWRYAWPSTGHPSENPQLVGSMPEVYADFPIGADCEWL